MIEGSSVSVKELESSEAKVRGEQAGHGDDSGDLHTYRAAWIDRPDKSGGRGGHRRQERGGRGKWENILADTEADAANDSVRGNLRVLSVLATWGPPTSNHEPAHASTSFPADQPPLERASFSASNDFAPTTRPLVAL